MMMRSLRERMFERNSFSTNAIGLIPACFTFRETYNFLKESQWRRRNQLEEQFGCLVYSWHKNSERVVPASEVFFSMVKGDCFTDLNLEIIREYVATKWGKDVDVVIHFFDSIPRTNNGKNRFIVQKLDVKFENCEVLPCPK